MLAGVLTQNVDGLHQAAGAESVIELHGSLDRVRCLTCGDAMPRAELDARLREANPDFAARASAVNPDGDVELADEAVAGFRIVDCQVCPGGVLKPDVVFFGETVPAPRVLLREGAISARLCRFSGAPGGVRSGCQAACSSARSGD